jgi:hypothetical protein
MITENRLICPFKSFVLLDTGIFFLCLPSSRLLFKTSCSLKYIEMTNWNEILNSTKDSEEDSCNDKRFNMSRFKSEKYVSNTEAS